MRSIGNHLRELFQQARKTPTYLESWQQWFCPLTMPFVNKLEIERFIDQFFLLYIPDTLTVHHNHEEIYRLLHILLIEEHELAKYERESWNFEAKIQKEQIPEIIIIAPSDDEEPEGGDLDHIMDATPAYDGKSIVKLMLDTENSL
jgi:hypothetical protein